MLAQVLQDAAAMVATLEQLIFDSESALLEAQVWACERICNDTLFRSKRDKSSQPLHLTSEEL